MNEPKFIPGEFYHFFSRANSQQDRLFYTDGNYRYFLQGWQRNLQAVFEVWAYCLLPNHFHFLIRVRENPSGVSASELWRRFAIGFTMAINKQQGRRGSLFQEHPKSLRIKEESHLLSVIRYIHRNPAHHGVTADWENWRYSSYSAILGSVETRVARAGVLGLFGGVDAFRDFHLAEAKVSDVGYCLAE